MLNYILSTTYGDSLKQDEEFELVTFNNVLFEDDHLYVKVVSENLGDFEIRILNFDPSEDIVGSEIA